MVLRDVEIDLVEGSASDPHVHGAAAELCTFHDRLVRDIKRHGALVLQASD